MLWSNDLDEQIEEELKEESMGKKIKEELKGDHHILKVMKLEEELKCVKH